MFTSPGDQSVGPIVGVAILAVLFVVLVVVCVVLAIIAIWKWTEVNNSINILFPSCYKEHV